MTTTFPKRDENYKTTDSRISGNPSQWGKGKKTMPGHYYNQVAENPQEKIKSLTMYRDNKDKKDNRLLFGNILRQKMYEVTSFFFFEGKKAVNVQPNTQ